jgi:hypothetical protein
MNPTLARILDHTAIQLAGFATRRRTKGSRPVLLDGPIKKADLFEEITIAKPQICFTAKDAFHFPSQIETACPENNTVHGRLYRCGKDWRQRPAVILVHGLDYEIGYRFQFPYLARRLCKLGLNTAMLELPYHCRRRPHGDAAVKDFISNDLESLYQAIQQSIADIRALTHWLYAEGCPNVGLWGISLGAWLSGLVACADDRIDFIVLCTPVGKIDRAVKDLAFCEPIRDCLQKRKLSLARLNLVDYRPRQQPDRILIVESLFDRFAPVDTVEEIWRAWGQPEIIRVNHGHVSVLLSLSVMKRIMGWIASKAVSDNASVVDRAGACNAGLDVATGSNLQTG